MASEPSGHCPQPPGDRYAVRILRVEPGQQFTLRMLSERVLGLFTHWQRGRSVYCPGQDDCPSAYHKAERFWKGYVAAEIWMAKNGSYYPTCLEVTESAELDLRGRYKRGQLWRFERLEKQRGKKNPVQAVYLESQPAHGLPPAFDPLELLQQLYHRTDVRLDQVNPLPGRMFVAPHVGEGPLPVQAEEALSAEEASKLFKQLSGRNSRNGKGGDS